MCLACGKGVYLGEMKYVWCGGAAVSHEASISLICRIQLLAMPLLAPPRSAIEK